MNYSPTCIFCREPAVDVCSASTGNIRSREQRIKTVGCAGVHMELSFDASTIQPHGKIHIFVNKAIDGPDNNKRTRQAAEVRSPGCRSIGVDTVGAPSVTQV